MSAVLTTAWCRACGAVLGTEVVTCFHCGSTQEVPDPGPARVGRVVEVKSRLGHRNGLVLRDTSAGVELLVKGDVPVQMPAGEVDGMRQVEVPGPPVVGAAGRLWKALRAANDRTLRGKWSPEIVGEAAMSHALVGVGARRAAVLDAITLAVDQELSQLGLSESEISWYRARAAAIAQDTAATVAWLERLPAHAYAGRVPVLMSRAADLLTDPQLAARAGALLEPFIAQDLDARALRAALIPGPPAEVLDLLVPFAASAEHPGGDLAPIASETVQLERAGRAIPDSLRTVRALDTYLQGRSGIPIESGEVLGLLPVPLLDDLIDRQVISPALAGQVAWRPADAAYLRCRLNPGAAAGADVVAADFAAELARRYFLYGNFPSLNGLSGDDPAVLHYQALARWRESSSAQTLDGLRPNARRLLAQVGSLRTAAQGGVEAEVPEEVIADPSIWPLIFDCALKGLLRLPDHLRDRYPQFAEWLELCTLQRLVFQGSFSEVISGGTELARRTALEVTSDEAKNMVAFAEFQQGRDGEALRVLDDALGGQYTTGLIVNASIVAAVRGSEAALPYLSRIVSLESDPAVRQGAVQRAVQLWFGDASSQDYPPALRDLVRQALSWPEPDELHQQLLRLAQNRDTDWLAADVRAGTPDPVHVASQVQADVLRYRRTWARANTAGRPEGLKDVAEVLVAIAGSSPSEWADSEMQRFIREIDEAVHVAFGEALYVAPAIDVLLTAGVLDPVQELVFAAQAGAHVACYFAENDDCISAEAERRLIFDTVRRFHEREGQLSESGREYAGDELARCVSVAAHAMGLVAKAQFNRRGEEWDQLVRREQYDYQNRHLIIRMERDLLDDLDSYATRLRTYLRLMRDLPLNEAGRNNLSMLSEAERDWSAEIDRLRRLL